MKEAPHVIERLDRNQIPQGGQECHAILVVYNEGLRLPWLLRYYRSLGISRFFFIDNNSTDGTVDFLLRQKDCHVFLTHNSYLESGFGRVWQQNILDRYGDNHWWLIVDADEAFVYPSSETITLPQLCHYLDSIGAEGMSSLLLDMYSKEPISEAVYQPGQPFTDVCAYFDHEYSFWPRPQHRKLYKNTGYSIWKLRRGHAPLLFPAMEPIGGPRLREFYPRFRNPGPITVLKMKIYRHLGKILTRLGIKLGETTLMPGVLFKVPLIKAGRGARLIDSHSVANVTLAPVTGALLHFKFFADFHKRVVEAVQRGEHFDSAPANMRCI